jgi:hypothetical protein
MDIECTFDTIDFFGSKKYACEIKTIAIKVIGTKIKAVMGVHKDGKSSEDVEGLTITYHEVKYFPLGLNLIFPKLKHLRIVDCGLKEINRDHFIGLEELETLDLNDNNLSFIPENLFKNMKKLKKVSFNNNCLRTLSSKMMQQLVDNKATSINFGRINMFYAAFDKKCINGPRHCEHVIQRGFVRGRAARKTCTNRSPPERYCSSSLKELLEKIKNKFVDSTDDDSSDEENDDEEKKCSESENNRA